jgi:hypothetical protein
MLIGKVSRIQVDELFRWGVGFCFLGFLLVISGFASILLFSCRSAKESSSQTLSRVGAKSISYETIGKGALSLNSQRTSQFLPWLGNELLLFARNTRPDAQRFEKTLLIGVKAFAEEKKIGSDEKIYLSELDKEKEGKRGLRFSGEKAASIILKPLSFNRNSVTFEMVRKLEDQKEEKSQLVLTVSDQKARRLDSLHQKEDAAFAKTANEAKHLGKDRLLEVYGGEEWRFLKEKEKIQFTHEGESYVCFVSTGEYLMWDEGKWKVVAASEISSSLPVAQVKSASPRGVELEVWDETGFFRLLVKIETHPPAKTGSKESTLFSSIRLRNGTQVTCVAGKRRMVLREGDWVLKTPSGFRNLKKLEQIEDCIYHRLQGELFVFDQLETVQGKSVMKGHFFDATRQQMQTLSFPISSQEKKSSKRERRLAK